jgi:hypothetical protein
MEFEDIKIYHIVYVDRICSIIENGGLYADSEVRSHDLAGTTIGMLKIKERRLLLPLSSRLGLHVGECVPFTSARARQCSICSTGLIPRT